MFTGLLGSTIFAGSNGQSQMPCPLQKCCRFCLIHHIDIRYSSGIGGLFVLLDSFIVSFFQECVLDFWQFQSAILSSHIRNGAEEKAPHHDNYKDTCMLKLHCFCC